MNDELIAGERFNPALRKTLSALLDTMIPASEAFAAPSAGSDKIMQDVLSSMTGDAADAIEKVLNGLNERANARFEDVSADERWELFEELQHSDPGGVRTLGGLLLQCYYRNDQALESIGLPARAPYPLGHEVEQGDLSLLDPVRARGKVYRDV